jgi:hypothetical protein
VNLSKSSLSILIAALSFSTVFVASVFTTGSTVAARVGVGKPMSSQQPISGVGVTVENIKTHKERFALQTDAEGNFSVDLAPGLYRVTLECKKCKSMDIGESGVQLTLTGTKESDFKRIMTKSQLVSGVEFPFEIVGKAETKIRKQGQVSLVR